MTQRPFPIPVRARPADAAPLGPGSQPGDGDDVMPDVLALPRGMNTFEMPHVPQHVAAAVMLGSADALQAMLEAMRAALPEEGNPCIALDALSPAAMTVTDEVLGEGEVSIRVAAHGDRPAVHAQESVFAGLWRCGEFDAGGRLVRYWLEAGGVPAAVTLAAAHGDGRIVDPQPWPTGTMNAPSLLAELRARIATAHEEGGRGGQLNLSLLPLSPADREVLAQALPPGPVAIISRGFGNCHIGSTIVPGVWRQQYFNSVNTLILDLVEITTLPEVVAASAEDMHDSRERLSELVQWMRETAAADSGERSAALGRPLPPTSAATAA
jgi:hydrogenase-1 operon protein HyaF